MIYPIKFDKYFWIARFFPAIISLIPLFLFQYLYFDNLIFKQLKILEGYSVFFHSVFVLVAIYIVSIVVRGFGKDLIEYHYFIKNNKLPTTQILIGKKKEISVQELKNIKDKIKQDFNIDLNKKCSKREKILRINDSVNRIRAKVGYNNKILNQYNMEYGFFRNQIGGLVIFFLTDGLLMMFSHIYGDLIVFKLSVMMLLFSIIYIIFSWYILDNYGSKYAKQLFNEYMVG